MKRLLLAATAILLTLCTATSFADTLKLTSADSYSSTGVAVYPYNFSVNGSATTTSLMCINYDRRISVGEQWNVSVQTLTGGTDQASINYRAAAYLFSQMGTDINTNTALQYAAWYLFTPGISTTSTWSTAMSGSMSGSTVGQAASSFITTAQAMAQNTSLINSGFFSKFQLYTPLTDTASAASWTNGIPQAFIGPAPTPEPSGLILLGTGLLGTVGAMRRKRQARA